MFLPENYETPQGGSGYLKFQQGETKFRILSKPIIGWLDWKDQKPYRYGYKNKPEKPFDPAKPVRHFWAMVVFDYGEQQIKVLEITQLSIQKPIEHLAKDSEWGNPCDYDLKVTKKGQEKATEYTVTPSPKKPVSDEIKAAAKAKPVNLEALYKGEDPFTYGIDRGEVTALEFNGLPF